MTCPFTMAARACAHTQINGESAATTYGSNPVATTTWDAHRIQVRVRVRVTWDAHRYRYISCCYKAEGGLRGKVRVRRDER